MATERHRKREALLERTEQDAPQLAQRYQAGKIDRDELNRHLGTLHPREMAKHFVREFEEYSEARRCERKTESIGAEHHLASLYVVRTILDQARLGDAEVVRAY